MRWHTKSGSERETPAIDAFITEIIEVYKKHGFSISHEDSHGGFLIEKFDMYNVEWLQEASDRTD